MMKRTNTKKALLLSMISLLLCCSMLIGTTFAWFTDTTSTNVNSIISGKLDVKLEYSLDGTTWKDAEGETLAFKDLDGNTLWEPGCTYEMPLLRVTNAGNLALKYQIAITGLTGDFKLLEVVDWTVNGETLVSTYAGTLAAGASSDALLIKGHMQETAGNEYMSLRIDDISITVYATQLNAESDSYGPDYDAGAYLPIVYTAAELKSALENGESVKLGNDITLDANAENGNFVIPAEAGEVVLDLNGYTLTAPAREGYNGRTQYALDNYADLTIQGNGTINSRGIQNYGKLTIEDGVTVNAVDTNGGACIWAYAGSETTINGGTFTSAESAGCVRADGKLTINGGTFTQTQTNKDSGYCYAINFNGTEGVINNATINGDHGCVAVGAGTLTINDGAFTCTGVAGQSDHVLYASAGTLTVNGGSFVGDYDAGGTCACEDGGDIVVYGGAFGMNPSAVVAAGYKATQCGDEWLVTATNITPVTPLTVQAVINAAQAGDTIILNAGAYHDTIVMKSGITLQGSEGAVVDCINLNGASNVTLKGITFDAAGAKYSYNAKGKAIQPANIISRSNGSSVAGAANIVIEDCIFNGTFADGGVVIAFTDQNTTGYSNITVKGCEFDVTGGYTDIYAYYSGNNGSFVIENNTFSSTYAAEVANMLPIYLANYQSGVPVVVKNNDFQNKANFAAATYLTDHSNYGVSFDAVAAATNTFAN